MVVQGENVEQSRDALLKSLEKQLLKQHVVHDAQNRAKYIFECPVDTKDGGPCLVTEYKYIDATETIVIGRREGHYRWKAAWDAGFDFNQSADIDPDANGVV